MAVILIDGAAIPAPSTIDFGIMDLQKAERNANGTMIMEKIATKRKMMLSWSYLTRDQLASLFAIFNTSKVFFDVTYIDPIGNTTQTKKFYVGDRSASVIDMVNGIPRYKDVKFDLIER